MSALRSYREKKNLSQEALGKKLGVSRQTVDALENGRRRYTGEMAVLIEEKLGLNRILFRPDLYRRRSA